MFFNKELELGPASPRDGPGVTRMLTSLLSRSASLAHLFSPFEALAWEELRDPLRHGHHSVLKVASSPGHLRASWFSERNCKMCSDHTTVSSARPPALGLILPDAAPVSGAGCTGPAGSVGWELKQRRKGDRRQIHCWTPFLLPSPIPLGRPPPPGRNTQAFVSFITTHTFLMQSSSF